MSASAQWTLSLSDGSCSSAVQATGGTAAPMVTNAFFTVPPGESRTLPLAPPGAAFGLLAILPSQTENVFIALGSGAETALIEPVLLCGQITALFGLALPESVTVRNAAPYEITLAVRAFRTG
jgi:hypothetical protein